MLFSQARSTSLGLLGLASILLIAGGPSVTSATPASNNVQQQHASLQGLLLERQQLADFFNPEHHNTPRHAAAPLDAAHAHSHARHRRHSHGHSKRGQCMKRTKAVAKVDPASASASASSQETAPAPAPTDSDSELAEHRGQGTSDDKGNSSSSKNQVELKPTESSSSSSKKSKPTQNSSSSSSSSSKKPETNGNVSPISPNSSGSNLFGGAGLFSFVDETCGKSGAIQDVTKTAGPNGAMDFLNCGLDGAGWTPPDVKLADVLVMQLDEALEDDNSPFQACKPFLDIFDKYAKVNDLPSILLASIAMQESSCNPNASGDNGGAYGLMQITGDKCTKGISCSDPDYNVKTGAAYLKSRLDANDGNILLAMGEYNGWYKGLTIAKATAIKDQCCECQNNVNYHMQMLNGWLLNKNGYDLGDWSMGC